jgi:HSP20 family molecular chaperone IbpA
MWSNRSFLPRILGNDYWDVFDYPTSIFDQDFGLDTPALGWGGRGYGGRSGYGGGTSMMPFDQNLSRQGFSNVQNDQNKFAVNLDCKQFKPEELNVTVDDQNNQLLIHGKHEERSDEHGYISREFRRRYALPQGAQIDKVNCNLDNGVLSVEVPKQPQQPQISQEGRRIPINYRGQQQLGQQQQQGQLQQDQGQQGQQIPVQHQGQQQDVSGKLSGQKQTQPAQTAMRG